MVDPSDPFVRFIAIWISFNALYENNLPAEKEWQQIDAIAQRADLVASHSALLAFPSATSYRDAITVLETGGVHSVRTGKQRTIDSQRKLASVLGCIYQIRCNLFHGGKHRDDDRDRQLSEAGFTIIASLLHYTMTGNLPSLLTTEINRKPLQLDPRRTVAT